MCLVSSSVGNTGNFSRFLFCCCEKSSSQSPKVVSLLPLFRGSGSQTKVVFLFQVETFLGIEHRISKDNFYFNESRGFYCFKSDVEERCLVESKGRPHPAINPIVLQKLRSFFRQHNHRLYRLVDRDFGWP